MSDPSCKVIRYTVDNSKVKEVNQKHKIKVDTDNIKYNEDSVWYSVSDK